jgi:cyclopropane-fatty-acyl-phospholipid synthase
MTVTAPARSIRPVVDAARWPDVAAVPGSPSRAAIARALFARACAGLPVSVIQAGGRPLGAGGPAAPRMVLHRPADFYHRVGSTGLTGFGESYMAGDWDSPDLTSLLTVFASRVGTLVPQPLQRLRRIAVSRIPSSDDPTPAGARRNTARHYDLSNEMFALFLDPTMTYSSGLFEDTTAGLLANPLAGDPAVNDILAAAQRRKIDRLLDLTGVGPGCRLLEIGTGWGELAIRAARRGALVRTATISAEQHALAVERVGAAGLADRISVDLLDYRELAGCYDAIVSVEMIEAVGPAYWRAYFATLAGLLAQGGTVGLQAITMPHERMVASRNTLTWIGKYIFPGGGRIPSVPAIRAAAAESGLAITSRLHFGPHYARTLQLWRERFDSSVTAGELARLGFDEVFRRMWNLYLAYSEAGFRSGYLDVCQLVLTRADRDQMPPVTPASPADCGALGCASGRR